MTQAEAEKKLQAEIDLQWKKLYPHDWHQPVHRKYCAECKQVYDAWHLDHYGTFESNCAFGAIMLGSMIILLSWVHEKDAGPYAWLWLPGERKRRLRR